MIGQSKMIESAEPTEEKKDTDKYKSRPTVAKKKTEDVGKLKLSETHKGTNKDISKSVKDIKSNKL